MRFQKVGEWGGFSQTLRGLWVDSHGSVFAAGDSEIRVFDAGGHVARQWGVDKQATCVAVRGDGRVYCGGLRQVQVFDGTGKSKGAWRDEAWQGVITAVGFAADGGTLVADSRLRAIRRYDRAGKFMNSIGADNRTEGFLIPNGVLDFSVDSAGVVHAANPGKHRVERYTLDGKLLGHIGHFDGVRAEGFSGCCNPTNVRVFEGRSYVTEKAGPRAKVLDADGKLIALISDSVFDSQAKNMAIAVGGLGRVYVADSAKLRIHVFEAVAA